MSVKFPKLKCERKEKEHQRREYARILGECVILLIFYCVDSVFNENIKKETEEIFK